MQFDRIMFEATNHCNMKCTWCPNENLLRKKGFLDENLFQKTIEEIKTKKLTETISFVGIGEPLADPNLPKKIQIVKDYNLKVALVTNGLLLRKLEVVFNKLDVLYISFQTINADSFQTRNIDKDFSIYKKEIFNFLHSKKKSNVRIGVSLLVKRYRHFQTKFAYANEEYIEIVKQTKAMNRFVIELCEFLSLPVPSINIYSSDELYLAPNLFINFDELTDWAGELKPSGKVTRTLKKSGTCATFDAGPMILANGEMTLCCIDANGHATVGNVANGITQLLNSDLYQKVSEGFKNKRIINTYCQTCKGCWKPKNPIKNALIESEVKLTSFKFDMKTKGFYYAFKSRALNIAARGLFNPCGGAIRGRFIKK